MLQSLKLVNFRSYVKAEFELGPDVTVVVGPNASGKTNLLEAIYVLAVTRSFRTRDDRDLINHHQTFFVLEGATLDAKYRLSYEQNGEQSQKTLKRSNRQLPLSQHLGGLPIVLFEPDDLDLIGGRPGRRRNFLDFILCQTDPTYLTTLRQYRRVLRQRNSLLEGFQIGAIKDQILVWDLKLTELATDIYDARMRLIEHFNQTVADRYRAIADKRIELTLVYRPSIDIDGNYADSFLERLNHNLTRDLAAGFTTIGPHREDFAASFGGGSMTSRASRGETRTAILALKLAELAYQEIKLGQKPLLLLDDVFSELDAGRRRALLSQLGQNQTIITTTDADAIKADLPQKRQLIKTAHG